MTPKEKALELINKFGYSRKSVFPDSVLHEDHGKSDALICVDEVIRNEVNTTMHPNDSIMDYWEEVKQEINKL